MGKERGLGREKESVARCDDSQFSNKVDVKFLALYNDVVTVAYSMGRKGKRTEVLDRAAPPHCIKSPSPPPGVTHIMRDVAAQPDISEDWL